MKSILANSVKYETTNLYKKHWYAIHVRSRQEKKVHQILLNKGVQSSLPLIKTIRKWSDRKKKVMIPLFKGYVFIQIDFAKDKVNILKTDGVVKFVGIRDKPSKIPYKEIHWIHKMAEESNIVQNEKEISMGQKVRVMAGPFQGMEGVVMTHRNKSRILICIGSIMQAVSIEIKPYYLEKINRR